jgi:hypothetical protein
MVQPGLTVGVESLSWKRRFDDPIGLPDGRRLITLQDAGTYITKLPKSEHEAPEWQAAMEALILVATHGGVALSLMTFVPSRLTQPQTFGTRDGANFRRSHDFNKSLTFLVRSCRFRISELETRDGRHFVD